MGKESEQMANCALPLLIFISASIDKPRLVGYSDLLEFNPRLYYKAQILRERIRLAPRALQIHNTFDYADSTQYTLK